MTFISEKIYVQILFFKDTVCTINLIQEPEDIENVDYKKLITVPAVSIRPPVTFYRGFEAI